MARSKKLLSNAEKFANILLFEATNGKLGAAEDKSTNSDIPFADKRSLLDSMTKLLAIKHKVDPKEETSGFAALKERLNGTASRETWNGGGAPAPASGAGNLSDVGPDANAGGDSEDSESSTVN